MSDGVPKKKKPLHCYCLPEGVRMEWVAGRPQVGVFWITFRCPRCEELLEVEGKIDQAVRA